MALPRILLFLLLVGQDGLHHVAGLGDVGEINLWLQALLGARSRGARLTAGPRSAQLGANLVCFEFLQRTGVRFARGQAEFR
jgi:hypothetical protein